MRFNIEKKIKIKDRVEKSKYLSKYHTWLQEQRQKDRDKLPYKDTEYGRFYLRQDKCPYCKEDVIIEKQKDVIHKICKKHGLLQVNKNQS